MKIGPQRINVRKPCAGYYVRWYYNGWHYWWFLPGRVNMLTDGEEYRTLGTKRLDMSSGQVNRQEMAAIRTILNAIEIQILTEYGWKWMKIDRSSAVIYDNKIAGAEIDFIGIIGNVEISETGLSPEEYTPEPPPVIYSGYGMLYNAFVALGHSNYYKNIGALYNWFAATNIHGIAPAGWHLPTEDEFTTLANFVGGNLIAGGKLKTIEINFWFTPNLGATNEYGFNMIGAGGRDGSNGNYTNIFQQCLFWNSRELSASNASIYGAWFDQESFWMGTADKNWGMPIRHIKDDDIDPGIVIDFDNNIYSTIKIGNQVWMAENFKSTHYNDGIAIPIIPDPVDWAADLVGGMCYYNNFM